MGSKWKLKNITINEWMDEIANSKSTKEIIRHGQKK